MRFLVILAAVVLLAAVAHSAPSPFFDAIYDALNGNSRRSYGYSGYGNSGYGNSGYGNYGYRPSYAHHNTQPERMSKSYKDLCRVHFPNSVAVPGSGGILCPY